MCWIVGVELWNHFMETVASTPKLVKLCGADGFFKGQLQPNTMSSSSCCLSPHLANPLIVKV